MINNTPESKLDETVKNTLSGYEAQYDASDWSRMESMLDAAPKSSTFKWSHAITVIIGIVIVAGGYGLFSVIRNSKDKNTEVNSTPVKPIENTVKVTPKVTPPPATKTNPIATPPVKEETKTPVVVPEKIIVTPDVAATKKKEKVLTKEEQTKNKKTKTTEEPGGILEPHDKIIGMGNEPVFGDMLDSSKGIIGATKEKEETRKAAKARKDTPVEWNQFTPHMNIDSMRRAREKQRDSLKTE
jgi:type IV secretory pathway VirB10-like protein